MSPQKYVYVEGGVSSLRLSSVDKRHHSFGRLVVLDAQVMLAKKELTFCIHDGVLNVSDLKKCNSAAPRCRITNSTVVHAGADWGKNPTQCVDQSVAYWEEYPAYWVCNGVCVGC